MDKSAYLIYGNDEYLVSSKGKEIVDALVPPEERALGLEMIDGHAESSSEAVDAVIHCIEALKTLGFFGNRKVVWFKDVNFLTDTRAGRSETVKNRVKDLAGMVREGLPTGQVLVVTASGVNKARTFYRACKDAAEIHEFEVSDKSYIAERQASGLIGKLAADAGLEMSSDTVRVFLERVGTDTRQLAAEIEKMRVFLGDRKRVKVDDIEAVTASTREAVLWDLADAFGKRDLTGSLKTIRRLVFQKESPIRLIGILQSRIRELMLYREALDKGWLAAGRDYRGNATTEWGDVPAEVEGYFGKMERDPRKTHPFRVGLLAQQARGFSAAALIECERATMSAHEKLLSASIPKPMVLELLLVRMIGGKGKRGKR